MIAICDYIYVDSGRGLTSALLENFSSEILLIRQLFMPIYRATENRSVGGSIPPLAPSHLFKTSYSVSFSL